MTPLPVAISPCPNDTVLFYPWILGFVGKHLPINVHFADIEQLNSWALAGKYPLVKISCGLYPFIQKEYAFLPIGAALGHKVGPKIIAKKPLDLKDLKTQSVAIPGIHTTAHLLFKAFAPKPKTKVFLPYHQIVNSVANGEVDCGVIIHESRFTFHEKGLVEVADLGALWHQKTSLPLPLGGLALKRDVDPLSVTAILQKAAHTKRDARAKAFILEHAQDKRWSVAEQHIKLYFNAESHSLSAKGKLAFEHLLEMALEHQDVS